LHGTSDTLRALLERRAERQKQQIQSSSDTDTTTTLATRTPIDAPTTTTTTTTAATAASTATQKNRVKVRFWLQFRVEFGQSIVVVGGSPDLGNWVLADGVPLAWSEGDMWNATVDLPAGTVTEYKYVVVGQGGHAAAWQQGNNSVLALRQADDVVEVYDNWGGNPGAQVLAAGAAPMTRESRLLSWATELEAQVAGQRQELRRARMELVAAQEEARVAREESKKLKMALAKSETDRIAAVANLKQAETVNQLLQTQLKETTMSFSTALETAMELLTPAPKGTRGKKAAAAAVTKGADEDGKATSASTSATTTPEVEKKSEQTSSNSITSTRRI
jgi:Starch binding domain